MQLTGSRALDYWSDRSSDKSDWDIIASERELNKLGLTFQGKDYLKIDSCNVEFLNTEALNNAVVSNLDVSNYHYTVSKNTEKWFGKEVVVTVQNPCQLYITKRSHIWRPLKFVKHIHELKTIKEVLVNHDLWPIPETYQKVLEERIKLTKKEFGDRVPSLNKSNDDFFDDAVTKQYVHDDLHKVVAYYNRPLYEKMKENYESAKCEKRLWDRFTHEDKVRCVREECYVIGLERFLIPKLDSPPLPSPKFSFHKALEKVCTTLTSGWFRDFAIDNYFEIADYDVGYYGKFFQAKDNGDLKECLQNK